MNNTEHGLSILLVDDDADSRFCFSLLLDKLGHRTSSVSNGSDAIDLLRREPRDVVLCDLSLTEDMSGLDLANLMQKDPQLRGIPIIALTGHGLARDLEATRRAGFAGHLVKPLDLAELQAKLRELRIGERGVEAVLETPAISALRPPETC